MNSQPSIGAIRDQVFISYSHADKRWLDELQVHLKPYVRQGSLDPWSDQRIRPGAKWREEIQAALRRAKVAVLLVSPNFLASDFIAQHELPPLLKAAELEGVVILWVPVSSSAYDETPIADYQAALPPSRPLDQMKGPAGRNPAFVKICRLIKEALAPQAPLAGPQAPAHAGKSASGGPVGAFRKVRSGPGPQVAFVQQRSEGAIVQTGAGAIAVGPGAVAAGEGGIAIGGSVEGGIRIGGGRKAKRRRGSK
jgi:hypothetical protein